MTEKSNSNDDNGAGQIAMTDDLFGGLVTACTGRGSGAAAISTRRSWCTRPIPTSWFPGVASPTDVPPLQIADRYPAGPRHD